MRLFVVLPYLSSKLVVGWLVVASLFWGSLNCAYRIKSGVIVCVVSTNNG